MKNKIPAFFLIEALVSLFITGLVILTLSFTINSIKSINQNVSHNLVNDFHLAIIQRDLYLGNRAKLVAIAPKQLTISEVNNSSTIYLEQYKNMIRVRGLLGGHMPLLFEIDEVNYQQINSHTIKEDLKSRGGRFETYLFLEKNATP